jgi:TRAP-type C4-dicarboxylate transport system permease small subunit
MPALARILPWLVVAFCLLALALGAYEWSHPPFTDARIAASLPDTWEVAASTTRVFGVVFLGLGAICVVLARKATDSMSRVGAWLGAGGCLLVLLLFLRNHIELTQRATALTGQEFGALFGLL